MWKIINFRLRIVTLPHNKLYNTTPITAHAAMFHSIRNQFVMSKENKNKAII